MSTRVTDERAAFGVERAAITTGRLVSVAVGDEPGLKKRSVRVGRLVMDHGLEGDRHGGRGPRQLSLLDTAVLEAMCAEGIAVDSGDLGENLLIAGLALDRLVPGTRLRVGAAIVEITGARPLCGGVRAVDPRALKAMIGRPGQMARVVVAGEIRPGDAVEPIVEGVATDWP